MNEQFLRQHGPSRPEHRNPFRTFASIVCGVIAIGLIGLSIVGVWFQRTVADTSGYVRTVSPLAKDSAVRSYIRDTASDAIIRSNNLETVAPDLVRVAGLAGISGAQLNQQLDELVRKNVERIVNAPTFQQSWESINRTAHDDITGQLRSGATTVSTDLSPFVDDALKQFESAPQLAPYKDRIVVPEQAGKFSFSAGWLSTVGEAYKLIPYAATLLITGTVVFFTLSIFLARAKLRAAWLILAGGGLGALLLSTLSNIPPFITFEGAASGAQPAAEAFSKVFLGSLSHTLAASSYIILATAGVILGLDLFRRYRQKL